MTRREKISIWLLFCIGLILRLLFLGKKVFWADELWAISLSEHNLRYIWNYITLTEINPPFFYYIVKTWRYIVGTSELNLRLLPCIFGSITSPLLYIVLKKSFIKKNTAFLISFLFTFSPFHITFSQILKTYTILTFLTLLSLWIFLKLLITPNKILGWIELGVINGLLLYFHNLGWLIPLIETLYYLIFVRKQWLFWFVNIALTFLIFIPWLPSFWYQFTNNVPQEIKGGNISPILRISYTFFTFTLGESVNPFNYLIVVPAFLIFVFLFSLGIRNLIKEKSKEKFLFLLFLSLPLVINTISKISWPQNFIPFLPIFIVIIGLGIEGINVKVIKNAALTSILIIWCLSLFYWYRGDFSQLHDVAKNLPYREINEFFIKEERPGEIIITTEQRGFSGRYKNFSGFDWYYKGSLPVVSFYEFSDKKVIKELSRIFQNYKRIWLLLNYNSSLSTNEFLKKYMEEKGICLKEKKYLFNERTIRGKILKELPRYYYFFEIYLYQLKDT